MVTKVFQKSEDTSTKEQEIFTSSFRQAGRPHKSPKKPRKREHSYKEKEKLIYNSQRKITEFVGEVSPPPPFFFMFRMSRCYPFPPKCISYLNFGSVFLMLVFFLSLLLLTSLYNNDFFDFFLAIVLFY